MRCGEKCFVVEVEVNGEKRVIPVKSRTSVQARKTVRIEYGSDANIIKVVEEKKVK